MIPPYMGTWDILSEQNPSAYHGDVNHGDVYVSTLSLVRYGGFTCYHTADGTSPQIVSYHRCVQLLLQPQLYATVINDRYFELCMNASRGVCEGYKRMYHGMPMAFSSLALQTVFIAGLTMVYGLWYKNSTVTVMHNFNALNDCSVLLYVMSERWAASTKYRDAYESIKRTVIDRISEGLSRPRRAPMSMPADLRDTLQNIDVGMADSTRDALEQMIAGITGEQLDFSSAPQPQPDCSTASLFDWSWDRDSGMSFSPFNTGNGDAPAVEEGEQLVS